MNKVLYFSCYVLVGSVLSATLKTLWNAYGDYPISDPTFAGIVGIPMIGWLVWKKRHIKREDVKNSDRN